MAVQQAGQRRPRALYPEPGHRQWVAPPPAHLKCSVCEEPFGRAAEAQVRVQPAYCRPSAEPPCQPVALPCGHSFCRGCVTRWFTTPGKLCPTGRCAASKGVKPTSLCTNITVQAAVDLLPVFCRFGLRETQEGEWEADPQGCPAQLPAGEAAVHEASCGFQLLRCSFAGCGAELRRSEVDAHDAAEARQHARGEREARLAGEAAPLVSSLREGANGSAPQQPAGSEAGVWTLQRSLAGHAYLVAGCAFHPDGALLASASYDNSVKLWDVATGECVRTLEGHTSSVACCAFSPNGATLLSGSGDGTLRLFDTSSGECLYSLPVCDEFVLGCAFSRDGAMMLSACGDRKLRLWYICGNLFRTFRGHTEPVCGCAFSPDGATLLSCSFDGTLKLWNAATGECLRTLEGHSNYVVGCDFSPDGALVASAGDGDLTVKLWDAATGECIRTLCGHTGCVNACCFSPDGATLLSGADDGTLMLWRTDTGECLQTLAGHHADWILSCAFSRDGRTLASGGGHKTVQIWAKQSAHRPDRTTVPSAEGPAATVASAAPPLPLLSAIRRAIRRFTGARQ